jgi:hypothetical protein
MKNVFNETKKKIEFFMFNPYKVNIEANVLF